uniref:Uncharacterized protein n=1 Tax=Nelumbo nucifera TaxID=4432 RepID=A0A822Y3W2_NELNU|nr:TPA_asm: hypothetical protein HUJ06_028718 [Nelumbo nucifera]
MLKSNPTNPFLLRNYGQFLHEVEKDVAKAEEYYGRAVLVSPGDGEVLSLYGKLIWEMHRDQDRAQSYFDQAVQASPSNCYCNSSYMWTIPEAVRTGLDRRQGSRDSRSDSDTAAIISMSLGARTRPYL